MSPSTCEPAPAPEACDASDARLRAQMPTSASTAALVALVALVALAGAVKLAVLLRRRLQLLRQLSRLPGPRPWPLLGTTYLLLRSPWRGLLQLVVELHARYSPLFCTWTGPYPEVHLIEAEHIEVILNSTKHFEKSYAYKLLHPWLGDSLLTSQGSKWRSLRKLITPAFHFSILENFLEVFAEKSKILVDKLQLKADGNGFDIYPYITRCTLDVICDTAMGTEIYAQEGRDTEYIKAIYDVCTLTLKRIFSPLLHLDFIYHRTKRGQRYKECIKILHGFTDNVIKDRRNALFGVTTISKDGSEEHEIIGTKRRKAFLDLLLETSQDNTELSDKMIREEVDTFMFAGHDTTAVSTTWTIYMLGHHPEIQEKVYAELQDILQESDGAPSMRDLQRMKYLEQVIRESLRLYPSIPFIQRKLSEDVHVDGFHVPAGCTVTMHIYLAHRNPKHFPDPEKFDPDNFLPERTQCRHPFAFIPFSGGARNCIGQRYALLEEKCILSSIVRKFTIRSLEDPEEIRMNAHIVLKPTNGVKVALSPRE